MSTLLSLKWNHHHSTFVSVFSALKSKDLFCDVSVVCGSRVFPAHKLVLAASSPFFQHMLARQPQWAHPLNMVIVLQDIDSEDFEALLEYMYKGEASVPQNALSGLIRTAEQLQIRGLATGDSVAQLVKDNETMLAIAEGGFTARGSDRSCAAFHFKKNTLSPKKSLSASTASPNFDPTINENPYEKTTDSPAGFMNGIINREILGYENSDRDSEDVQNESPTVDLEAQHSQKAISEEAHENPEEDLSSSSATNEISDNVSPNQSIEKSGEERAACLNTPKKRSLSDPVAECQPERTKQQKHSTFEENKLSVRGDLQSTEHATVQITPPDATLPDASEVVKQEPLYEEEDSTLNVDAHTSQGDSGGLSAAGDARNKDESFLDVQVWSAPRGEWSQWTTDGSAPPPPFAEAPLPREFAQFTAVTAGPSSSSSSSSSAPSSSVVALGSSARETCAESASQIDRFTFNRPSLSVVPVEASEDSASGRVNAYSMKLNLMSSSSSNNLETDQPVSSNQGRSNVTHSAQVSQHPEDLSQCTGRANVLTPQTTNGSYSIGRSASSEESVSLGRISCSISHPSLARMPLMPWKCRRCSFATADASIFSLHAQLCKNINQADPKPFKCNKCPYSAKSQSAFNYHQKTHSGVKPFACRFCSYRTILKRSLVVHLRTHTQEKPYACPLCSYRANQKSNLDTHMNRHLPKRVPR